MAQRFAGGPRYAEQLALAMQEPGYLSSQQVDRLDQLTQVLRKGKTWDEKPIQVGRPLRGEDGVDYNMKLKIKPAAHWLSGSEKQLVLPQQVDQLLKEPPKRVAEVAFGWNPVGTDRMIFEQLEQLPPAVVKGLGTALKDIIPQSLDRLGFDAGDMVLNSPEGAGAGDYRRSSAYLREGWGPLGESLVQYARVARPGQAKQYVPDLLEPPDPGAIAAVWPKLFPG